MNLFITIILRALELFSHVFMEKPNCRHQQIESYISLSCASLYISLVEFHFVIFDSIGLYFQFQMEEHFARWTLGSLKAQ